ncbi:mannose-specific lectin-like [Wolffia australiana]
MAVRRFPVLSFLLAVLLASACTAKDTLYFLDFLDPAQSLTQGNYRLTMQSDCNLVLYDRTLPVGASNTYSRGVNCYALFVYDGILKVFDGSSKLLWASGPDSPEIGVWSLNYILILQPDRNVVVHGPILWSTNNIRTSTGANNVIANSTTLATAHTKKKP